VLDPRISYEGLKIDYGDDLTLSSHLEVSKIAYSSTLMNIMLPCPAQRHCHLLSLFRHPWVAPLRNPSLLGIARKTSTLSMNWKSILNSQQKILIHVTQFSGRVGQQSQFPHLFQLAHDILCIPGILVSSFNSHDSDLMRWSQVQLLQLRGYC